MASKSSKQKFWLMKTEPDVFSYADLVKAPKKTAPWEGVRNYQARNFMRDEFRLGDGVLIYHSSCEVPGIVGVATVVKEAYPDNSALDPKSPYFDESSKKAGESRWVMVDVQAKADFPKILSLSEIKETKALASMLVIKRGMRLSIQPVTPEEWSTIMRIAKLA